MQGSDAITAATIQVRLEFEERLEDFVFKTISDYAGCNYELTVSKEEVKKALLGRAREKANIELLISDLEASAEKRKAGQPCMTEELVIMRLKYILGCMEVE